ncbi:MAG: nucleotidyl transferase [Deltaproteobacteria bacterium HGW-Deltaproteobacteria-21]|nr:MAG: nucleotidyl transferase [Deltaproteobacteria bacterium HGW-Deltaproteobacteria-21]
MFCVIMAGGSGTRFWPASLRRMPKQFLDITGRGPMVVETCQRVGTLSRDDELILVIAWEHFEETRRLFAGRGVHILAEPVGRNTAACIGLGALYAKHLGCEGPIAFLPADHFIADRSAFLRAVAQAASLAESGGIVTLGIVPTRPETGYGYIRRAGEKVTVRDGHAYRVSAFVEKPDLEKARQYVAGGEYFWNAGIFVATAETILREMENHLPVLHQGLERLKKSIRTPSFEKEIEAVYPGLESVSFDYGIMERTTCASLVVPCECGWSDVGSWDSLHELKKAEHDTGGNFSEGDSLLIDCEGSHVSSRGGKLVACLGLKNCLVVDTPDALLVADLHRSQDIRKIIEELKRRKREKSL